MYQGLLILPQEHYLRSAPLHYFTSERELGLGRLWDLPKLSDPGNNINLTVGSNTLSEDSVEFEVLVYKNSIK